MGVLVVWFLNPHDRSRPVFVKVVLAILVLGVVWEIFEYVNDLIILGQNYAFDTTKDLVLDLVGATVAYFITLPSQRSFGES